MYTLLNSLGVVFSSTGVYTDESSTDSTDRASVAKVLVLTYSLLSFVILNKICTVSDDLLAITVLFREFTLQGTSN